MVVEYSPCMRKLPGRALELVLRHPRTSVSAGLLLTAVALWLGSGVELQTSRKELAPAGDPVQARWQRLNRDLGGASNVLVVVLEAIDPDLSAQELRRAADAAAGEIAALPEVRRVFHRIDLHWFLDRSLHLAPSDSVHRAAQALAEEPEMLEALSSVDELADLHHIIADRLEAGRATAEGRPPAEAGSVVEGLAGLLRLEARFLEDPEAAMARLGDEPTALLLARRLAGEEIAGQGYVASRDGRMLFVIVTPSAEDDSLPSVRTFVAAVRGAAEGVAGEFPGLRVALTGEPATTVEEMATVRRDTLYTSLVAVLGVTLLTLLVFRWKAHSLLVLLALAAGIAWSFGAIRLELGYLNLITTSFISTLVGVGIAYGIHPVSEYELMGAHTRDARKATRLAYRHTGAAVSVAAVTTSGAFFSILLMRFRGFAELGLVAGVGVLLCLLSALLLLPALLLLHGRIRRLGRMDARRRKALLDHLWEERLAAVVTLRPGLVVALAAVLTAVSGLLALGIRFDTNILALLPRSSEAVRYQERMVSESDLAPLQGMAAADSLAELRGMRDRAESEPAIARFESALRLLPENPGRSAEDAGRIGEALAAVELPSPEPELDPEGLASSLLRLEDALADAADDAFTAGYGYLAGPLEEARAAAERARSALDGASPSRRRAWSRGQVELLGRLEEAIVALRRAASTPPPRIEDLPSAVRQRYVTSTGRLVAYLHPAGNVFDEEHREEYLAALHRVDPDATGFPVVFDRMAGRITSGFYRAVAAGGLVVFCLLLLDLRRLADVLLAMVPLVVGVVWMLGAMRALGLAFNFANLVAVPLVIGVGIDNGVHVIHRVRLEGAEGMRVVVGHTGRAILIASLTTMIGFGSLSLASHRGLASLGMVLFLGVGACLATSILLLPNLLIVLRVVRR